MTIYDYLAVIHDAPLPGRLRWLAGQVEAAAERAGVDPHTVETALHVYAIYLALYGSQS